MANKRVPFSELGVVVERVLPHPTGKAVPCIVCGSRVTTVGKHFLSPHGYVCASCAQAFWKKQAEEKEKNGR